MWEVCIPYSTLSILRTNVRACHVIWFQRRDAPSVKKLVFSWAVILFLWRESWHLSVNNCYQWHEKWTVCRELWLKITMKAIKWPFYIRDLDPTYHPWSVYNVKNYIFRVFNTIIVTLTMFSNNKKIDNSSNSRYENFLNDHNSFFSNLS